MSTRSVIAQPQGDGWKGRYVHMDGYPTSQLLVLRELVKRDGVDKVLDVITEQYYGWSILNPDQEGDSKQDYHKGDRFGGVGGYGIAYTTVENQSSPEDWITHDCGKDDWGTEWGYVLYPNAITVLKNWGDGEWEVIDTVRNDAEVSDTDLRILECGEQYERCDHMAWFHFPELTTECPYGTREYLSHEVRASLSSATEVILENGTRFPIGTGGGIVFADGTSAWRGRPEIGRRPIYWQCHTSSGDIIVGRRVKDGLKLRYPIVLPPNAVRDEVVVPAGTVVDQ